jgi:hypothetical protein
MTKEEILKAAQELANECRPGKRRNFFKERMVLTLAYKNDMRRYGGSPLSGSEIHAQWEVAMKEIDAAESAAEE